MLEFGAQHLLLELGLLGEVRAHTGIHAALESGLAVGALLRGTVRPGLRILDERQGFPPLPEVAIMLVRAHSDPSPVVERLEEAILAYFRESGTMSLAA